MSSLMPDVKEVLISSSEIQEKLRELGETITRDYRAERPLLVGVLRGAVIVLGDLMRNIDLPCEIDFMDISSYGTGTSSSGAVRILKDLEEDITRRHVLAVEGVAPGDVLLEVLEDAHHPAARGARPVGAARRQPAPPGPRRTAPGSGGAPTGA